MKVKFKGTLSNDFSEDNQGCHENGLTIVQEYIVLSVYFNKRGLLYQIEEDGGGLIMFKAEEFEISSSYIPSNWKIIVRRHSDGTYCLDLSPKNWNKYPEGFYEEITEVSWPLHEWRQYEKPPEVVSLYFQERDLICREEEEYERRNKGV